MDFNIFVDHGEVVKKLIMDKKYNLTENGVNRRIVEDTISATIAHITEKLEKEGIRESNGNKP